MSRDKFLKSRPRIIRRAVVLSTIAIFSILVLAANIYTMYPPIPIASDSFSLFGIYLGEMLMVVVGACMINPLPVKEKVKNTAHAGHIPNLEEQAGEAEDVELPTEAKLKGNAQNAQTLQP